jgi:serine/threonine-protein kinase
MDSNATTDLSGDPRVGTVLQGRYRISERIAAGGMGVVYRGERVGLEKPVAIKFVHAFMASDPDIVRRFEIEAKAMSRVAHPACVPVIDFGVETGAPYLVMDFVTGETLRRTIERGPPPVDLVLTVMRQLLAGLEHAHGQGIVHRDVKPENVVLTEVTGMGVQARILDFGVAKLLDGSTGQTTGFALGTPSYMAPEQTMGEPVDARTDVYAAGVVLFECLTGRKPFVADGLGELIRLQREAPVPALRTVVPGRRCSDQLEAVVRRALAKRPQERFQSARAFGEALDAVPEARPEAAPVRSAAPVAAPSPPVERSGASRRWRLVAGAAAILAVVGLVVGLSQRGSSGAGAAPSAALAPGSEDEPSIEMPEDDLAGGGVSTIRPPSPAEVPGIERVQALLEAKRWQEAVRLLEDLQEQHADNAYLPYLLGNLYTQKYWGRQGIDAYREAIRRDPALRGDPVLIRNTIRLFISDRHAWAAEKFLAETIGPAAIPFLEETRQSKNPVVRRRAERVLAELR